MTTAGRKTPFSQLQPYPITIPQLGDRDRPRSRCCARPACCDLAGPLRSRRPGTPGHAAGRAPRDGRPDAAARRPVLLIAASTAVAALLALPLVFLLLEASGAGTAAVSHLIFRRLTADLLWNTVRLTVVVTVLCAVIGTAAAWCIERTEPARAPGLGGPGRGAAGDPRLRGELRLGLAVDLVPGLPRRGRGDDPRGVPAGLPPGGGQPPGRRPGPGGGGAQPRVRAPAHVLPDHAGPGPRRDPRRLPAGGPGHAGRVRSVRDPRLPDLHHRDLQRVLAVLQRPGRLRAVPGPGGPQPPGPGR